MYVLLLFFYYYIFNDFCQTNYPSTDLHQIWRFGRTLSVDEQSEVIFYRLRGIAVATIFVDCMHTILLTRDIS